MMFLHKQFLQDVLFVFFVVDTIVQQGEAYSDLFSRREESSPQVLIF